jgi:hypothetical protein
MESTKLQWITHASCLICYNDYFLITDPWYCKKAFTSWTVKPPPVINPKLIIDLTKTGKFGFLISHHHFDHYDIDFIKKCDKNTPIFITDFCENKEENLPEVKCLYESLKTHCNMENIIEIPIGEEHFCNFGSFKLRSLRREKPYTIDGIITIESPDCFIVHAADCWGIKEDSYAGRILKKIKPDNLPSIYMGQAGTASGWPLIYSCYEEEEKEMILKNKTKNMLLNIKETCETFNFTKALGYAHLSYVYANGIDFFTKYNYIPAQGKISNEIVNSKDLFLDIQPSSIVIPSDNFNIINLIPTIDFAKYFEDNMTSTPINEYNFTPYFKEKLDDWLNTFVTFVNENVNNGVVNEDDIDLVFIIKICNNNNSDEILYENSVSFINSKREKTLKCNENIIGNIINGIIPFKDLGVGYLGEFSRTPKEYYNSMFLMLLSNHSHKYFNCNVIDSEDYEHQE